MPVSDNQSSLKAGLRGPTLEVTRSPALSLTARPGDGGIRARRVAIPIADGAEGKSLRSLADALLAAGAEPKFVAGRLGSVKATDGSIEVDTTVAATPAVLFDAMVITDGARAVKAMAADGRVLEFAGSRYRPARPREAATIGRVPW